MNNFEFEWKGKKYWYSRSVAVGCFIFAKDPKFGWCILANKRGAGCPTYNGYWNAPGGFLDFNESCAAAACREVWEECGLRVHPAQTRMFEYNSSPHGAGQQVSFRFYVILEQKPSDFNLSNSNMEPDEVEDIQWIPVSHLDDYKWAFNHRVNIQEIYDKRITRWGRTKYFFSRIWEAIKDF